MQKLPMLCFNPPYPDNGTGAWTFPLYQAKRKLYDIAEEMEKITDCKFDLEYVDGYEPIINDPGIVDLVISACYIIKLPFCNFSGFHIIGTGIHAHSCLSGYNIDSCSYLQGSYTDDF